MKKNTITYALIIFSVVTPIISFAALDGVRALLISFGGLLRIILGVLMGLALVFFFWGVAQFILHAGEATTREDGKKKMLWGIIALFIMLSILGILRFISATIGIPLDSGNTNSTNSQSIPGQTFI